MYCPECNQKTKVIDSRRVEMVVARKRKCNSCGYEFYTEEMEIEEPEAIKYYWSSSKAKQRKKVE